MRRRSQSNRWAQAPQAFRLKRSRGRIGEQKAGASIENGDAIAEAIENVEGCVSHAAICIDAKAQGCGSAHVGSEPLDQTLFLGFERSLSQRPT